MLFFVSTASLSCILVAFCHFGNFSAVSKKHVFAAKANEFGMRVSFQHRWNSFHVIASIFMKTKYNHREPGKKNSAQESILQRILSKSVPLRTRRNDRSRNRTACTGSHEVSS